MKKGKRNEEKQEEFRCILRWAFSFFNDTALTKALLIPTSTRCVLDLKEAL